MTIYQIQAQVKPDMPKGTIGDNLLISMRLYIEADDPQQARRCALEVAWTQKTVVLKIHKIEEYNGPWPPTEIVE